LGSSEEVKLMAGIPVSRRNLLMVLAALVLPARADWQLEVLLERHQTVNQLLLVQQGQHNAALLQQHGKGHQLQSQQSGDHNMLGVSQQGEGHQANLSQQGHDHLSVLQQSGYGSQVTVLQQGSGHQLWVEQRGAVSLQLQQYGQGAVLSITQTK